MTTDIMIPLNEFCIHHKIEQSFVFLLKESGLIEVTMMEDSYCISLEQLPQLEKIIRLYEMDINLEGIETITHLLDRINMQSEIITQLNNRLRSFENEEFINDIKNKM